jgi:riboflavin kinase
MLLTGQVTPGFGRGARFLGIPTANLPDSSLAPLNALQMTGIYYGFARVHPSLTTPLPSALPSPALSGTNTPKDLSAESIARLDPHTAPYPPDSVPDAAAFERKRLPEQDGRVWPMVMSVGWNPYFANEKITAVRPGARRGADGQEVHIIHPFAHDFYGHDMSVLVLGYIRPELNYISKGA